MRELVAAGADLRNLAAFYRVHCHLNVPNVADEKVKSYNFCHAAAARGDVAAIAYVLNERLEFLNEVDPKGWTALDSAAFAGHNKVIEYLLQLANDRGLELLNKNKASRKAASGGNIEALRLLLSGEVWG